MATQTIEFAAPSGQTISTVRLFAAGSDTVVDTASATEYTNAKLVYYAQFTDLPAGRYRLVAINAGGTGLATYWVDTLAATGTYPAFDLTPGAIADQVWDEDYSQHNIAGSFGKLMNLLRKANELLEATVIASPAPSTASFTVSGLNYPSGAFAGAVLMWDGGASLAQQNSPILSYVNNGDGTSLITVEQAFTSAPVAGDLALIIPTTHVHSVAEIQAGLSTLTAGQVNAEVLDVLATDLFGELAAVPGASSSLKDKIAFLFMLARNKVTQTSNTQTLFADNTTTPVAAATTSDVGGTFTRGEFA